MTPVDYMAAVGGLIAALGAVAFARGSGKKADPADLMMVALKSNTEKVDGLLDTVKSMTAIFTSIDKHGERATGLLSDLLSETRINAAKDDARRH